MKKIITLLSIMAVSSPVFASFKANNWGDEMTNTKVYEQYTTNRGSSIGFRCDIQDGKNKDFMMTFNSRDNVATPSNGKIKIQMKVDSGKVYNLTGKTYNNSYKGGVIYNISEDLLNEVKLGNKLLVKIFVYNQLKLNQSFSLSGSSRALQQTASKCDYLLSSNPEMVIKIRQLEKQRDQEIKKITQKYNAEINKIKDSYK